MPRFLRTLVVHAFSAAVFRATATAQQRLPPWQPSPGHISLTRLHAAEWHVDAHKIGVIGLSAGGHLVAATSVHFEKRVYRRVDATEDVSCRPDFAIAIYPGHLAVDENSFALQQDVQSYLSKQTPPTFLLQNEDDEVDGVERASLTMPA